MLICSLSETALTRDKPMQVRRLSTVSTDRQSQRKKGGADQKRDVKPVWEQFACISWDKNKILTFKCEVLVRNFVHIDAHLTVRPRLIVVQWPRIHGM